jgi:hypothetical protein
MFSVRRVVSMVNRTWENIYPTFSSSLGSTLLLIEKATHDPLYLWDITYRTLNHCSSTLEAELVACDEGLQLALNWSAEPIQLETDCANAVKMLKEIQGDSSVWVHLIQRIKQSLWEREVTISKIDRVQNEASHCLANRGRLSRCTQF